jgi:AraC-like DNA-binding protein
MSAGSEPKLSAGDVLPSEPDLPCARSDTPRGLSCFNFSTDAFDRSDQFEEWRKSFNPVMLFKSDRSNERGFSGHQRIWDIGSLALVHVSTEALTFSSPAYDARRAQLDLWAVTIVLSGSVSMESATGHLCLRSGDWTIWSPTSKFAGKTSDAELMMLFIPSGFSPQVAQRLAAHEMKPASTGLTALLGDYLMNLANRITEFSPADAARLVSATRDTIIACLPPPASALDTRLQARAELAIIRARELIKIRMSDPKLNARYLQHELGLSRTVLYKLFEPFGGVQHFIQHCRLKSAYAALADPCNTQMIANIRQERGFDNCSEFSRSFRREFGVSPKGVRRRDLPHLQEVKTRKASALPAGAKLGLILGRLQS